MIQINPNSPFVNTDGTLTAWAYRTLFEAMELLNEIRPNSPDVPVIEGLVETPTPFQQEEEAILTPMPPALSTPYEGFAVGMIAITVGNTDPGTLLGYGTWSQIGMGQYLVGQLTGDPDFGTAGTTGGSKTASISVHTGTAVADHTDHTHSVTSNVTDTTGTAAAGPDVTVVTSITNNAVTSGGASATLTHTVTQPANHSAITILPPFLVVYFWQRIS